jgi:hypothetical protein
LSFTPSSKNSIFVSLPWYFCAVAAARFTVL